AAEFGPNKLRICRGRVVREGHNGRSWSRKYVNRQVRRVVACWKWGVSHELVPESSYRTLATIEPLVKGKTDAPEPRKVQPAELEHVMAALPHLSKPLAAAVRLQLLSASRGDEILSMKPGEIDRSHPSGVWFYQPERHKGSWRSDDGPDVMRRIIGFGPRAQEVLMPLLLRPDDAFVISPADAPGGGRKHIGQRYSPSTYRSAIRRACERAGVPTWRPHQLRHLGTDVAEREFDDIDASKFAGHSDATFSRKVYISKDIETITRVVMAVG
ncbi:MAG: tyrosine-type recombinase/integrase, partial [Planctomycetota bacterium]